MRGGGVSFEVAQGLAGAAPILPILAASLAVDWERDTLRPGIIQRAPMRYPREAIADLSADARGWTFTNSSNGAVAMVATGGLSPGGTEYGYLRFTPNVAGGYTWGASTRTAVNIRKAYKPPSGGDQWWIAGIRVPSSVTPVVGREFGIYLSRSSDATKFMRLLARHYATGGTTDLFGNDSVGSGTATHTTNVATSLDDVIWVALKRSAGDRTSMTAYLSTAIQATPPALSTFTQLITALSTMASTDDGYLSFAPGTFTNLAQAFVGDILYYDDSGALPVMDAAQLSRYASGAEVPVVPALGFVTSQPTLVVAQGPCSTAVTQAKVRALLAACENTRTGLDTATWTWKVERSDSDSGYASGSFAAAGSVVVAGTGAYIRVTAKAPASGIAWGSINTDILRSWSSA